MSNRIGVPLLSGGIDSSVATYWAKKSHGLDVYPLTIDYGQVHVRELESAERVAKSLGIKGKFIHVPDLGELAFHSALTGRQNDLPLNRTEDQMGADIPISYVPMRNSMFLSMAASYMEALALEALDAGEQVEQLAIIIGANAIDYSGYPDCRQEYLTRMTMALNTGSKVWTQHNIGFDILAPLVTKTKRQIVRLGLDLDLDLGLTYSCYRGEANPCGQCDSCQIRDAALEAEGVAA